MIIYDPQQLAHKFDGHHRPVVTPVSKMMCIQIGIIQTSFPISWNKVRALHS